MFNPNSDVDVQKIFNDLGAYFNRLDADSKAKLEAFWKSLIDMGEASYHNLFAGNLTNYLQYTDGHIDRSYNRIQISEDTIKRVYSDAPVNTTLSEVHVPITDGYKYASIPKIVGYNNQVEYTQGIDYFIRGLDTLVFTVVPDFDYYIMDPSVGVNPVLSDFYLPRLGGDIAKIMENQEYVPFIQGWAGQTGNEKQINYLFHLMRLVHGVVIKLRQEPTMDNLTEAYGLLSGYPFSYEAGIVTAVTANTITVEGDNSYTYDMGEATTFSKSVGQTYEQFELLRGYVAMTDAGEYMDSSKGALAFEEYVNLRGDRTNFDLYIHDTVIETFPEDENNKTYNTTIE